MGSDASPGHVQGIDAEGQKMSPREARIPASGIPDGIATLRMCGASAYQISDHAPAVSRSGVITSALTPACRIKAVATTRTKPVQMKALSTSVVKAKSGPTGGVKSPISRSAP